MASPSRILFVGAITIALTISVVAGWNNVLKQNEAELRITFYDMCREEAATSYTATWKAMEDMNFDVCTITNEQTYVMVDRAYKDALNRCASILQ